MTRTDEPASYGVYQVRSESLASVTFVESDTGYVVIDPLTTVELPRAVLSRFVLGEIGLAELKEGSARIDGGPAALSSLAGFLDQFPLWFPIATHDRKFGGR